MLLERLCAAEPYKPSCLDDCSLVEVNESSPLSFWLLALDRPYQFIDEATPEKMGVRAEGLCTWSIA
jgi:hypothetical protein